MYLPDDLWRWILKLGVESSCLSCKDLCCLSMSCRRLNRLSNEEDVWSKLLSSDFPSSSSTDDPSPKSLYQIRFKEGGYKRFVAERRAVLRIESHIREHERNLGKIDLELLKEQVNINYAIIELKDLRKVREASMAFKLWKPEVGRRRQKQIAEHSDDFRMKALEMEIKLCKEQISGFEKAREDEKSRLEATKEQLSRAKYHPLRGLEGGSKSSSLELGFFSLSQIKLWLL